jgi:dCMP deaminase
MDIRDELRPIGGYNLELRPTRHLIFMEMAFLVADRGTCSRAQVGAVITQDRRPISMGYNGTPPGQPHCDHYTVKGRCVEIAPCTEAIHAELNAIAWAARAGVSTKNAAIYCSHQPCVKCGHAILAAGIQEVYWAHRYREAYEFPEFSVGVYMRVIPRGYMIIPVE